MSHPLYRRQISIVFFSIFVSVSAYVLNGCSSTDAINTIELGQEFRTRFGQQNTTADNDFVFNISKIIRDNRTECPRNINCLWNGEIIVLVEYSIDSEKENTKSNYRDVRAGGVDDFGEYSMEILKVRPRRPSINNTKYRFTIKVTRNSLD